MVEWNRTVLAPLAGAPLEDKRAVVVVDDVAAVATRQRDGFDAILLDVDNGPMALAGTENHHLYSPSGLATFRNALRSGGVLTVWSAGPDGRFRAKLERAGFRVTERPVASRKGSKAKHVLFLGARST